MNNKLSKQVPDRMFRENVGSGDRTYLKWGIVVLASIGLVVAIGVVVYSLIKSDIPDPKKDDIKTLVGFTKTDTFLEMNSRDRSKYLKDMTQSFESLSLKEQKDMAKDIQNLRRTNRKAHLTFAINFASGISEQLDGKSEEEQRARVKGMMQVAEVLQGGRKKAQREYDRNFYRDGTPRNRERFMQDVRRDSKVLLTTTTAVQRMKMIRASKTILQEAHNKYGD